MSDDIVPFLLAFGTVAVGLGAYLLWLHFRLRAVGREMAAPPRANR
jgi:hypothetical protein